MKEVIRYQTSDGALFETQRLARQHENSRYSRAMNRIVLRIVNHKFMEVVEFIDQNLELFQELVEIKKGMAYPETHDEEEPQ
jgi:hypothetical protein